MSENTLNILEMRCNVFKSMETKGEEITFEVKKGWTKYISKSLRQDYKGWVEDIVRQMEVADDKGNVKAVHRLAGV